MSRVDSTRRFRVKIREPYGGSWIEHTVNIKLDEDGHIIAVSVTNPEGIEHRADEVVQ